MAEARPLTLHPRPATTRYNRLVQYGVLGGVALVILTYLTVMSSRRQERQWERPDRLVTVNRPLLTQTALPAPPPSPPPVEPLPVTPPPAAPPVSAPPQVNPDVERRKAALLKALSAKVLVDDFRPDRQLQASTPVALALQPPAPQLLSPETSSLWASAGPDMGAPAMHDPRFAPPIPPPLVGRQRQFWQQASTATDPQDLAASLRPPLSPYHLQAGTFLPAVLAQALVSDVEGTVTALVARDVYDSVTGQFLLVPQGSRLFGVYDADLQANQPRLHLAFKTLYFPNGYSLALHGMPGAEANGQSGVSDEVNRHFWQRYGTAAVLSLITAGIALALHRRGGFFTLEPEEAAVYGAGNVMGRAVAEDLRRGMQIRPTVTIRAGYPFMLTITQDITLPAPYPFLTLAATEAP